MYRIYLRTYLAISRDQWTAAMIAGDHCLSPRVHLGCGNKGDSVCSGRCCNHLSSYKAIDY